MRVQKGTTAGLLLATALGCWAQAPAAPGERKPGTDEESVTAAALAGSKQDAAAFHRGAAVFKEHCAGCHGPAARGGPGAPDLVRSVLVLDDEKGILIAPVIRNGRPDQGMPKLNLTEPQIADAVVWLHVQTYAADHRTTYAFRDVVTGDAKKGEAYFRTACAACHSASGDLKGIGGRYDPLALQARWLQPRGGRGQGRGRNAAPSRRAAAMVTVTLSSGQKVSGRLDRIDDFNVSLYDAEEQYHCFAREGTARPKVEIEDPLAPHERLLAKYTDGDIHDVTAYLVTLK